MEHRDFLSRIGGSHLNYTAQERMIEHYILSNMKDMVNISIKELAEQAGTSQATISRFCRKLGYKNFREFLLALSQEAVASDARIHSGVTQKDSFFEIASSVLVAEHNALESTFSMLDYKMIEQLAHYILSVKPRIHIFGVGGSSVIASDLYNKLIRLGMNCSYSYDIAFQQITADQLRAGDLAWIITFSGYDADMLLLHNKAKERGAITVCMTNNYKASMAVASDYVLCGSYLKSYMFTDTTESRLSLLYLTDALFIYLSVKGAPNTIASLESTKEVLEQRLVYMRQRKKS
ncbi:MAG: MurR/RpiR family transcriptional regulator [Bacillota bacterium]